MYFPFKSRLSMFTILFLGDFYFPTLIIGILVRKVKRLIWQNCYVLNFTYLCCYSNPRGVSATLLDRFGIVQPMWSSAADAPLSVANGFSI